MTIDDNSSFPKINRSTQKGEQGMTILKEIIENDLGWFFRPNHLEHDFGIDGYMDIITDSGQITGKSIAFQLKSGSSYFTDQNEIGIIFKGERKHLNYYLNLEIPILIIILDINSRIAFWEVFDGAKTEQSGDNWKMTIPRMHQLNVNSKKELLKFVGPITDYVSQLENEWKLNQLLTTGSKRIIFRIPREEITNKRFDFITSALRRIQATPDLILSLKGKVDISFDNYDDDKRELFEIQEVKDWIIELYSLSNCWPYLMALDQASAFLKLAFYCFVPFIEKRIVDGRFQLEYETKNSSLFLWNLFEKLNDYCKQNGLSEETNKEISEKIIKYFVISKRK
jgi:hypothetical protein